MGWGGYRVLPYRSLAAPGRDAQGRRVRLLRGSAEVPAEFGARADPQLAVDAGQVGLDGLWADEHRGRDVAVGHAGDHQLGDALLRRGELGGAVGIEGGASEFGGGTLDP